MLIVCKYLMSKGVKPEDIARLITWRSERTLWYSVDGAMNSPEFLEAAAKAAMETDRSFSYNKPRSV
jgi:hypothetical protein